MCICLDPVSWEGNMEKSRLWEDRRLGLPAARGFPGIGPSLSLQSGEGLERGCHGDPEQAGCRGITEGKHPLIGARKAVQDVTGGK